MANKNGQVPSSRSSGKAKQGRPKGENIKYGRKLRNFHLVMKAELDKISSVEVLKDYPMVCACNMCDMPVPTRVSFEHLQLEDVAEQKVKLFCTGCTWSGHIAIKQHGPYDSRQSGSQQIIAKFECAGFTPTHLVKGSCRCKLRLDMPRLDLSVSIVLDEDYAAYQEDYNFDYSMLNAKTKFFHEDDPHNMY